MDAPWHLWLATKQLLELAVSLLVTKILINQCLNPSQRSQKSQSMSLRSMTHGIKLKKMPSTIKHMRRKKRKRMIMIITTTITKILMVTTVTITTKIKNLK